MGLGAYECCQLVQEFRLMPREYRRDVLQQVRRIRRLVKRPKLGLMGEEAREDL